MVNKISQIIWHKSKNEITPPPGRFKCVEFGFFVAVCNMREACRSFEICFLNRQQGNKK